MDTISYWSKTVEGSKFAPLHHDLDVDVVVVGGGITGITTAYLLKKAGATVALVERGRWGMAETGQTTAHLTYVTDTRLTKLVSALGREHAEAVWDAGLAAMNQIQQIVEEVGIECDFAWVPGYLHVPADEKGNERMRDELREDARLAREFRFEAAYLDEVPLVGGAGVRFANQAKFHPRKYLEGLIGKIPGEGSHVFEQTEVNEIKPPVVMANTHRIRCRWVVIATHVPLQGAAGTVSAAFFQTKLQSYSTYAVGAKIARGTAPEASFWDTADPYQYLRIDPHDDHDYAILGGADHKTGQADNEGERYATLEKRMREMFSAATITHRWSGQVVETSDSLPFIGETAPQQFAGTGFSGNGMTFGTLAAMMACDAFRGQINPWRDLFRVERKVGIKSAWDYVKENLDYPYYMAKDLLVRGDDSSFASVKRGHGKVILHEGAKLAVYRDELGRVTARSAICPHMGCVVRWNDTEKTWDCPCHGSRFEAKGSVMAGPAETDLAEVE